jgi:hypothetical protein
MTPCGWLPSPIGIDAPKLATRAGCRTALIVVHTLVSGHRLLDVVDYIESDPRVQVAFAIAPDAFNHAVPEFLRDLDALVLPWEQATRERFDLALAAAYGGLHELHAPLVVLAHGARYGKHTRRLSDDGRTLGNGPVYGLSSQHLTRDGRVLASAVVLAHEDDREILRQQCPEALPATVVAGDPCYDRLLASLPRRGHYRAAMQVTEEQKLVVVASTWGREGLFGHVPDLLPRIMTELPADQYRVAALLHPAVWSGHGIRQVRAWLRDCREAGLILLDPREDWRALVVAADYLIGDHGSVTAYAAAIGRPILHLPPARPTLITPGSVQELVTARAARLDPRRPLLPQLQSARLLHRDGVAAALTSRPGRASTLLSRIMYRLLRLPAPARHRRPLPVPVPRLDGRETGR